MTGSHQSLLKLITYLAAQPTMDRLAQFLVLETLNDYAPRGAMISSFDNNGRVHAAGSFGLADQIIRGLQHLSIWDRAPFVDVIRVGEPLFLPDGHAVRQRYPWLSNHEELLQPTVAWPLILGEERLGAVQVQFVENPDEQHIAEHFESFAPVVALYVGMSTSDHHEPTLTPAAESNGSDPAPDGVLTERQMAIVRMLARGMTNPQIAARIGFSDSTVRQETMAIYRHLGATDRRDAARIAAMRGLLAEEPPSAELLTV